MSTSTAKSSSAVKEGQPTSRAVPSTAERGFDLETMPTKGHLVSFGDRVTYTFACGSEVGAIHFDGGRNEIFYKGHNIRNMEIEEWQMQILEDLREILGAESEGKRFIASYGKVLDKVLLEKKRQSGSDSNSSDTRSEH
jgi:hypothetical protein